MDIIIQSLGFKAGDTLESFVTDKLNALKDDKIVRANVTFFKGPDSVPENNYCEIRLEVPGNDHFVKKTGQYFETAAHECVEVLTQMLKKAKDKNNDRRQAEASTIQDELLQGESELEEVELEDVVR
jgi:ribosome-associated translation inhibitor RaiA